MKKILIATFVVTTALASSVMANPSGDRATGEYASEAGGSTSDHTTAGLATAKSGGKNNSGGR
jgi:hypothetical protein